MKNSTYQSWIVTPTTATFNIGSRTITVDANRLSDLRPYTLRISNGYVQLLKNRKRVISLHRFLTNCPKDMVVDHINHNGLDNTSRNLRVCTKSENARNNSGRPSRICQYKGVVKDGEYYRAYTRMNGRRFWFGTYKTEVEAALAYNKGALEMFGEFACLNAIPGVTTPIMTIPDMTSFDDAVDNLILLQRRQLAIVNAMPTSPNYEQLLLELDKVEVELEIADQQVKDAAVGVGIEL